MQNNKIFRDEKSANINIEIGNTAVVNSKGVKSSLYMNGGVLPFRLKNIHYYGDNFAGDLVIMRGIIYYFPVRDLIMEREKDSWYKTPGLFGILIDIGKKRAREGRNNNKSYFDQNNLWKPEEGEEILRKRLDNYIAGLKMEERRLKDDNVFSSYSSKTHKRELPFPMCFEVNTIKNLKLLSNRLYFETVADKHDFTVSSSGIKSLSNALQEAKFITL
jgi:hypothetical protein